MIKDFANISIVSQSGQQGLFNKITSKDRATYHRLSGLKRFGGPRILKTKSRATFAPVTKKYVNQKLSYFSHMSESLSYFVTVILNLK